jgi:hypothetical protein
MKRAISFLNLTILVGFAGATDLVLTGKDTYMIASHGTIGWSSGGAQKA